jgi:methionine-rich copper-binding protein CopC
MLRIDDDAAGRFAPIPHAAGDRRHARSRPARGRGLLVLAVLGLVPGLAWGHAALVRSTPAQRAMLARPPDRVRLWFNEPLEAKFATVSVWDDKGVEIDQKDSLVESQDPKALSVGVPTLGPGTYTVKYRVLSVDGHVVEGSFRFTVRSSP